MASLKAKIRVASGDGMADLLIKNGRVVDVFSGEIEKRDVAVFGGVIVGFGDYRAWGHAIFREAPPNRVERIESLKNRW